MQPTSPFVAHTEIDPLDLASSQPNCEINSNAFLQPNATFINIPTSLLSLYTIQPSVNTSQPHSFIPANTSKLSQEHFTTFSNQIYNPHISQRSHSHPRTNDQNMNFPLSEVASNVSGQPIPPYYVEDESFQYLSHTQKQKHQQLYYSTLPPKKESSFSSISTIASNSTSPSSSGSFSSNPHLLSPPMNTFPSSITPVPNYLPLNNYPDSSNSIYTDSQVNFKDFHDKPSPRNNAARQPQEGACSPKSQINNISLFNPQDMYNPTNLVHQRQNQNQNQHQHQHQYLHQNQNISQNLTSNQRYFIISPPDSNNVIRSHSFPSNETNHEDLNLNQQYVHIRRETQPEVLSSKVQISNTNAKAHIRHNSVNSAGYGTIDQPSFQFSAAHSGINSSSSSQNAKSSSSQQNLLSNSLSYLLSSKERSLLFLLFNRLDPNGSGSVEPSKVVETFTNPFGVKETNLFTFLDKPTKSSNSLSSFSFQANIKSKNGILFYKKKKLRQMNSSSAYFHRKHSIYGRINSTQKHFSKKYKRRNSSSIDRKKKKITKFISTRKISGFIYKNNYYSSNPFRNGVQTHTNIPERFGSENNVHSKASYLMNSLNKRTSLPSLPCLESLSINDHKNEFCKNDSIFYQDNFITSENIIKGENILNDNNIDNNVSQFDDGWEDEIMSSGFLYNHEKKGRRFESSNIECRKKKRKTLRRNLSGHTRNKVICDCQFGKNFLESDYKDKEYDYGIRELFYKKVENSSQKSNDKSVNDDDDDDNNNNNNNNNVGYERKWSISASTIFLLVRLLDTSNKGVLDFEMFCMLWYHLNNWHSLFQKIDVNNCGAISVNQFVSSVCFFKGYTHLSVRFLRKFFDRYADRMDSTLGKCMMSEDMFVYGLVSIQRIMILFDSHNTEKGLEVTFKREDFIDGVLSLL